MYNLQKLFLLFLVVPFASCASMNIQAEQQPLDEDVAKKLIKEVTNENYITFQSEYHFSDDANGQKQREQFSARTNGFEKPGYLNIQSRNDKDGWQISVFPNEQSSPLPAINPSVKEVTFAVPIKNGDMAIKNILSINDGIVHFTFTRFAGDLKEMMNLPQASYDYEGLVKIKTNRESGKYYVAAHEVRSEGSQYWRTAPFKIKPVGRDIIFHLGASAYPDSPMFQKLIEDQSPGLKEYYMYIPKPEDE